MRRILILTLAVLMVLSVAGVHAEEESGWENILLLGGDSRTTEGYARSDTMIILSINRDESLVKMTSILRDTWVDFPGLNISGKINAGTVYGGPELSVATVNEYFGTDIEKYVLINMHKMQQIVDLLGGIEIELTGAEARYLKLGHSGLVHLNGSNAVSYCRIRYIDNDYQRVMRQQKVLLAMAEKAQNMEVSELSEVADDIKAIINTNLDDDEMEDLTMALMVMDIDEVEQFRIPADGTFFGGMRGGVWLVDADFEANKELLREFIYD